MLLRRGNSSGPLIGDAVSMVSVPLSLCPNVLIVATLARRRLTGAPPRRGSPRDLWQVRANTL